MKTMSLSNASDGLFLNHADRSGRKRGRCVKFAAGAMAVALLSTLPSLSWASVDSDRLPDDLAHMSLEELGSIVVTSVSKKPESLHSMFVLYANAPTFLHAPCTIRSGAKTIF